MFQRLKGAIDNRIAEEQARQRQAQQAAQTRPPVRRRPQNQNAASPRPANRPRASSFKPNEQQPDPSDFVIGEDDGPSTPSVEKTNQVPETGGNEVQVEPTETEKDSDGVDTTKENVEIKKLDTNGSVAPSEQPAELSSEVRSKLLKLEKMEAKYPELLKAYRTAHSRIQIIEPFEASLRENTPLTSISDPTALVEYLNQVKLKGDMVLDELRRVTTEKDDFKKKFEQAEKDNTALKVEVEELKKKAENPPVPPKEDAPNNTPKQIEDTAKDSSTEDKEKESSDSAVKSIPPSKLGSISLFSPKFGATKEPAKENSEDLFSYDSEVPRLEQELEERTVEVAELNKQVASLNTDLAVARESTLGMAQNLKSATHELNILRDEKDKFETSRSELTKRIEELEATAKSTSTKSDNLQNTISELQSQKDKASAEIQKLNQEIETLQKAKSELESTLQEKTKAVETLNTQLSEKDQAVKDLEDAITKAKDAEQQHKSEIESGKHSEKRLATMQGIMDNLRNQLNTAEGTVAELKKDIQARQDEFAGKPSSRIFGYLDERKDQKLHNLKSQDDVVNYLAESYGLQKRTSPSGTAAVSSAASPAALDVTSSTGGGKKKNKKKKKGGKNQAGAEEAEPDVPVKVSEDLNEIGDDGPPSPSPANAALLALEEDVTTLRKEIEEKTTSIERLSKQIKDQEALQEEIETLRDDLLHQGAEHVEARDALKQAQAARQKLQENFDMLEKELVDAQKSIAANQELENTHNGLVKAHEELEKTHTELDGAYKELDVQLQEAKTKSEGLQKELDSTESLATARFKDITDLKELLAKAQPELRQLRSEVAELKSVKDDLKNREGEFKRLESRHEDLKSEMKGLSKRLGDKDSEIKELQHKIEQETKARTKVENELSTAQLDARVAENKRKDTSELLEQRQKDLTQAKEEASTLRKKITGLEDKISEHSKEIFALKEEVALKTALHSSSQSVLQSLRDQTHELSMQARESSARAESLEEELHESQRMLTERTRESQTMRMLLDQAQNGVEVRIREMKERMEAAIEERDRVEDEANVRDRRLMREVEDARNKMRDAQRQLKGLEDERDELETKNRDWKRRREELEQQAQDAKKDVEDIKQAMKGLRDALDESERQIREVETQKADLRRQVDETNERIEKLTKTNKSLSDDMKKLQDSARKGSLRPVGVGDSGIRSSRTSIDSSRSPAPPLVRDGSVSTPRSETPTNARNSSNVGLSQGTVDYVYLKNVLLQFMEQKDKSHQRQLVPVLGMLLHFDRKDEQKWMAAISAK